MPDARIPALEGVGLHIVPGYRILPSTGKEDPTWRARHFTWHEQTHEWRSWAQGELLVNEEFREQALALCAQDPAFFCLLFLEVEEPRSMAYFDKSDITLEQALANLHDEDADIGVDSLSYRTIHPFIPYAYQVQAMKLCTKVILGAMRSYSHDLLWDKARGVGMSYAFLAWCYWGWLFVPGFRGTILTEKWDKAERNKDVDSLFGKLDLFLDSTPDFLIPADFKWKGEKDADRLAGRLINPVNGAGLYTEPTTKDSTRSGRDAFVAVDELNFHEHLNETWATIHGTAKHCIGWTTASRRHGRQGERIIAEGKKNPRAVTVVTLDWFENPHQDAQWEKDERARFKAAGMEEQFDVEHMRNPTAGSGRLVYIQQLELTTQVYAGYDPTKPLKVSVDPGASDFTAWVFWQTHFAQEKKQVRWIEACQLRNVPVQFWAHVMTGIEPRPAQDGQPPDEMYRYLKEGFFELPSIARVMEFMAGIPPSSIMLYGDPSMASNTITHESWEKVFLHETLRLRQREFGADDPRAIPIMVRFPYKPLYRRNNYEDQRVGMRQALMFSEFYWDNEGVREFYDALQNTMFQKTTETSTRAPGHLHTDQYHMVSAGQYGMTWETLQLTPQDLEEDAKEGSLLKTKRIRPIRSSGPTSARQIRHARNESLVRLY